MSRSLFAKLVVVGLLAAALLIPLGMVSGLIDARSQRHAEVVAGIQRDTSGPQRVAGPVLVLPYTVRTTVTETVQVWQTCGAEAHADPAVVGRARAACTRAGKTSGETVSVPAEKTRIVTTPHSLVIPPTALHIDGEVAVSTLRRGLYEALIYTAALELKGSFAIDVGPLADDTGVAFGEAWLAIGVGDVRGVRRSPQLTWAGESVAVQAGNDLALLGNGAHAQIGRIDPRTAGVLPFELALDLVGTERLDFSPVAKDTRVTLRADWPHPSFSGRMLPASRAVRGDGFEAAWRTSWFATNMDRAFRDKDANAAASQDFGVRFIQPINPYQQTGRATDYGILFVLVCFTAFFLFEILARLRIHPMQYGLIGAALATFFLLVIALSEHVEFGTAYAVAAGACAALIAFYVSFVLRRWTRGVAFGGLLAALYAALYGVLQSEDHALLLGSALVFGALAAVMVLTRRLDWYAVSSRPSAGADSVG